MVPASSCRILPSQLGDDAGIIGGAVLAAQQLAKSQEGALPAGAAGADADQS
jgi:hypothetical protein